MNHPYTNAKPVPVAEAVRDHIARQGQPLETAAPLCVFESGFSGTHFSTVTARVTVPGHVSQDELKARVSCSVVSYGKLLEALNTLDEVRGAIMLAEVEGGSSELAYDVERVIFEARAALEAAKEGLPCFPVA